MPASAARISANRRNSAKSTGPKTVEGKERSRRNGLKHGMTGQGVVIPEADVAEVEQRDAALQKELAPKSVMGAILVGQMATLSIRMERGAKQEFAAVAERVRHASDDFDAGRIAQAEELLKVLGDDPRGNLRKLLKSPEGVDVLIEAWEDLRAGLTREVRPFWSMMTLATAAQLLGLREGQMLGTRLEALSRAACGDFSALAESDGGGLEREARKAWARARIVERIDEEIAGLDAHFETLDFAIIEQDRAEAGARASFDPSKEASLARRYESEARRGFFRALKEFRQEEKEAAERAATAPTSASPSISEPYVPLASSCDGPSTDPVERTPEGFLPVSRGVSGEVEVIRGAA